MRKEAKNSGEKEIDALFQLPLSEFTAARNTLASQLRKTGLDDEAKKVKALVKPSISAWAVNQLYWKHKEAFKDLIAAGQRWIQAQKLQLAGKAAGIQRAQAEQRQALSRASLLAEAVLQDAGHNPTPDMMRRVNSTLEALSTRSSASDASPPGRLTADLNPPGFESLTSLIPPTGLPKPSVKTTPAIPFKPPLEKAAPKQSDKDAKNAGAAEAALHAAEQALRDARTKADELAAARKNAAAAVEEAEGNRLKAEELYQSARRTEQEARKRLDSAAAEAEKAARALSEASQAVEKARRGLKR